MKNLFKGVGEFEYVIVEDIADVSRGLFVMASVVSDLLRSSYLSISLGPDYFFTRNCVHFEPLTSNPSAQRIRRSRQGC